MKNIEKLQQMSMLDLLMDINIGIHDSTFWCIKECITGEYQFIDHDRCFIRPHNCSECIKNWLEEEVQ